MKAHKILSVMALGLTAFSAGCLDERVVAPEDVLPPVLAIDRPTVQLFRYARGRMVEADTVRITNNGEGPLGVVEQVGGVDYITTARTGWLKATLESLGQNEALLILEPTYAEDEQDAADVAEVVLKAQGSEALKRVRVIARTLRGALFEFSVSPLAFAALPGDTAMSQRLTVRNGGNDSLNIHFPELQYRVQATGWLDLERTGGTDEAPEFLLRADPGDLGGGFYEAVLLFTSLPYEEVRAKPDSVTVQLNIGKPALNATTSTLVFRVDRGSNPPPQLIGLFNSGEGPFSALGDLGLGSVTYGEGAEGWLQVSLGGSQAQVTAQTADLEAGDYQASFPILSANGGAKTIQVELSVEAPILTLGSRTVSFGMVEGDAAPPPPRSVAMTNTGAGPFASLGDVSLGSFQPAASWIEARIVEDTTILLTPTSAATSQGAGDHTTRLPVLSQNGGTDTLTVVFSVSRGLDPPVLTLSPTAVEFNAISGGASPAPQEVQVSNSGGGTLGEVAVGTIEYEGEAGWLSAGVSGTVITLSAATGDLPDGDHVATVNVSSELGGDATIRVTFAIGLPVLTASATSVSFTATEDGGDPADFDVTFTNTGPGTFDNLGTITVGAVVYAGVGGWLSTSYAEPTLTLSVDNGGLSPGTYEATVPVSSVEGGSVDIEVTHTVVRTTDAADLVASPSSVRMDALRGGDDPPAVTVVLSNAGGGILGALGVSGITYGPGASAWLSATLVGTTVTLEATTGSLAAGSYGATVGLTSDFGGSETVDVTFVVSAPDLTLSASTASFSGVVGGSASPALVSIDLSNTGAGDFASLGTPSLGAIVYGSGTGWLSAGLAGGNTTVELSATIGGRPAGTYTATVPVNTPAGGSESVGVTLTIAPTPPPPALALSATTAAFWAEEGGSDPDAQVITLSNTGGGDRSALGLPSVGTITYGTAPGWLDATVDDVNYTVTLTPITDTLTVAGQPYTATVPVQTANGGSQDISVTFNIYASGDTADLAVSPASVRMDAVAGGANPPDQEVLLYNAGTGPLGPLDVESITYGPGATDWLSEGIASGVLTLSADITGIGAGSYDADVEVSSGNGGNETIDVSLVVAGPILTLSSTSASFSGPVGGTASPASVTVAVSNTGAGDFSSLGDVDVGTITYVGTGGWLAAATAAGDTEVELIATLGGLAAGTHTATVPVTSVAGGSSSIAVTFTVSPTSSAPLLSLSASSVTFNAILGAISPAAKTVTISNSGGGTFLDLGNPRIGSITYGGVPTGWLSASSVAGSTLTLSPATASLGEGTHAATVEVISDSGGAQSVSVSVVVDAPILTASTRGLSFTGLVSGAAPATQTVTFSNTGAGNDGHLGSVTVGTVSYGPGATAWLDEPASGAAVLGGTLDFTVDQAGLAAGSYTATVPVTSEFGGSQSISVGLSVVRETDPPEMVLSATTQRFDALFGGADPPPQIVIASNSGGGTLGEITTGIPSYGSGGYGWLSATVRHDTIETRVRTGTLALGTYNALLPVTSDGGTVQLRVSFVVGTARLTLSPRNLSFGTTVGGPNPGAAMVAIANTGGGSYTSLGAISLSPTVYGEGASGWLEATLPAPDSVGIQASTGDLAARAEAYQARVPVVSTLGGSDTILVSFTVAPGTAPPQLALSLESMTFSGVLGQEAPPPQSVSGFNSGGGDIGELGIAQIQYTEGAQGWLLPPTVSESTVTLETDVSDVPSGTHRATVIVSSEFGGNASMEVNLVIAPPVLRFSTEAVTFSDTVGSPDTLQTQVFLFNRGAGTRASLGTINLGEVTYTAGETPWLSTEPASGEVVEGFLVGLKGSAFDLPAGNWIAMVPVESQWGGSDTLAVTFAAREPDRSFDSPTIELVKDSVVNGAVVKVPLPGDSVVVGPVSAGPTELGVRIGVRNGVQTRVDLTGLRVGTPTYPEGEEGGWITGAFLDKTTAAFDDPAELFVVVVADGLASGRYEGRLVVSSETPGLATVAPRVLRVILIVS